jgi:hypothetical protein
MTADRRFTATTQVTVLIPIIPVLCHDTADCNNS